MSGNFNNYTSIGTDKCEKDSRDVGNKKMADYHLIRPGHSTSASTGHLADVGLNLQRTGNVFSNGEQNKLADTSKASRLLNTRPFVTMPFMGAGNTSIVNPDKDSKLRYSSISTRKKEFNPAPVKSKTYRPMPMLSHIRKEIQDPVHIIPTNWQRGGIDTRNYSREADYTREHSFQR
jgi:hypothetical protein